MAGGLPAGGDRRRRGLGSATGGRGSSRAAVASPAASCSGGAARWPSCSKWSSELLSGWLLGEGVGCSGVVWSGAAAKGGLI